MHTQARIGSGKQPFFGTLDSCVPPAVVVWIKHLPDLGAGSPPTPAIDRIPQSQALKTQSDQMTRQCRWGAQLAGKRTSTGRHGWNPGVHKAVRQEPPLMEPAKATHRLGVVDQTSPIDPFATDADEVGVVEELPEVHERDNLVWEGHELDGSLRHDEVREGVERVVQQPVVEAWDPESLTGGGQGTTIAEKVGRDPFRRVIERTRMDLDQEFVPGQTPAGQVMVLLPGFPVGCHLPAPGLEMRLALQGFFVRQQEVDVPHDPQSGISGGWGQQMDAPLQDER